MVVRAADGAWIYKSHCRSNVDARLSVYLPVKRKSRGRSKGSKGKGSLIQCQSCGQTVPRDKAKRVSKRISMVDYVLSKELRQKGAYIASPVTTKYYCVSCAVHRGVVKVRSKSERKGRRKGRR